ncbi:hypothetical protein E0L36_22875 [Streptomyces sp. AJS327]|uniref:DUF5999 family protein n=1 Tax=Streptomyces sp. AJS327 TaxID=2545265 RepID=UPI001856BFAD|nr:DUF5999 family protein [Streptomyces sp. AJS327]MBA0053609.1 hypothetical protein [Streptomyces sp. AJS327]
MCSHIPACPPAEAPDTDAARVVSRCFEQGWTLLCNGGALFEDTGQFLRLAHRPVWARAPESVPGWPGRELGVEAPERS